MTIAMNFLITTAVLGVFASICALVQKHRLHDLFAAAAFGFFAAAVVWAIVTYMAPV